MENEICFEVIISNIHVIPLFIPILFLMSFKMVSLYNNFYFELTFQETLKVLIFNGGNLKIQENN